MGTLKTRLEVFTTFFDCGDLAETFSESRRAAQDEAEELHSEVCDCMPKRTHIGARALFIDEYSHFNH